MNYEESLNALDVAWALETGFLYKIRYREVDFLLGDELLKTLKQIDFTDQDLLPKQIVSYIWFIPLFMELQMHSIEKASNVEEFGRYVTLASQITAEVSRILGHVPEEPDWNTPLS